MAKKQSGQYTVFDANSWYFNPPDKRGTMSSTDLKIYAADQALKRTSVQLATGDIVLVGNEENVVKVKQADGTVITRAVVDPKTQTVTIKNKTTGKKVTVDTRGKKVTPTVLDNLKTIFSPSKNKKGQSVVDKQLNALVKAGAKGTIKFTPEGHTPYVTSAGYYQGQPGQWTTYAQSQGQGTITYFNPASGAPPSNFYGNAGNGFG